MKSGHPLSSEQLPAQQWTAICYMDTWCYLVWFLFLFVATLTRFNIIKSCFRDQNCGQNDSYSCILDTGKDNALFAVPDIISDGYILVWRQASTQLTNSLNYFTYI